MGMEVERKSAEGRQPLIAHLSMFTACVIWGLMAPLGKDAMMSGISGVTMVSFRVAGGALLFWLASIFTPKEEVPWRDKLKFALAAVFGIVCNQCGFTIGLSMTSPANASIVTTTLPIFAMILSFIILHEPITTKKVSGVVVGLAGALILILTSANAASAKAGDVRGDAIVLGAQLSYALFLSLFNPFVRRYSIFTVNKWMFLWATVLIWPFSFREVMSTPWADVTAQAWWETAYVVVLGTFVGYILIVKAQKVLRPTVVSIYNYVQPIVSVTVTVLAGLGIFTWSHALAVILVFTGVRLVTKSRSKADETKSVSQDVERA